MKKVLQHGTYDRLTQRQSNFVYPIFEGDKITVGNKFCQ
jgi:hypothetical protein